MSELSPHRRLYSVDLVRGMSILFMTLAHTIFFTHSGINPLLKGINSLADTITFSVLLVLSGISGFYAYIHVAHPHWSVIRRILKRLLIYFLGYIIISSLILLITTQASWSSIWQVAAFSRLVPFTEFIPAFILLGLSTIIFRPAYRWLSRSLILTLIFSVICYTLAVFLSQLPLPHIPLIWKAMLIGHPNTYSFPILQYLPLYLLGIWFGRQYWQQSDPSLVHFRSHKLLLSLLGVTTLASFIVPLVLNLPLLHRWPPSPAFILIGLITATSAIIAVERLHNLIHFPWTRNILLLFGQNAFALFFTHTLIIYLYQYLHFPQLHSTLLVSVVWITTLFLALYLAKVIPLNYQFSLTFFAWCECQWGECNHTREHHLALKLKRFLLQFINFPQVLSFSIGQRRIRPLQIHHAGTALVIFILAATPLGIAENSLLISQQFDSLGGTLNRSWILRRLPAPSLIYSLDLSRLSDNSDVDVSYSINDQIVGPMTQNGSQWSASIDTSKLAASTYQVKSVITFGKRRFTSLPSTLFVSYPLFVSWTIDWEGYDVPDAYLDALIGVSEQFNIPMTQLFNPRIYTAPDINPERADYLTQWVNNRRDLHHDEIGLHLHMFPDFIISAGLTPKISPAWGAGTGYDILTSAYDRREMVQILNHALTWFANKGLGTPLSYRAGGWFANADTLTALDQVGFLVDSSGRTRYHFGTNQTPGFWDLTTTTLPYFPSTTNQNSDFPPPNFTLLEIPNNGADDYAFSAQDMIDRFDQNYSPNILANPTQVTYLSHPQWFDPHRQQKMRDVFTHIDQYLYAFDQGPVIYATLFDIYTSWTKP